MRAFSRSFLFLAALLIAGAAWAQDRQPGWLGVDLREVTKVDAQKLGWQAPRGVKVVWPMTGAPAAAAGLEPGEVIVTLDGVEVENRHAFLAAVQDKGAGTVVEVGLALPGKERKLRVTLDPVPEVYLLDEQVLLLAKARNYREAMATALRALALGEQQFGPDDAYVAALRMQVGSLHEGWADAEADKYYKRALPVLQRVLGPDDLYVAETLSGLAGVHRRRREFDDAIPLYRRALAIREQALGANHPDAAALSSRLSETVRDAIVFNTRRISSYVGDGRYAEAAPLYKRVLALLQDTDGSSPGIEIAIDELMKVYLAQARYAEAEPLIRRNLVLAEKKYKADPENAWSLLVALNRLGRLLQDTGRFAEAEAILRRALAVTEKIASPKSIMVAESRHALATLLRETNRLVEAEGLYRSALPIYEAFYKADAPRTAVLLNDIAGLLRESNRLAEAEPLYRRTLTILETSYGPEHRDVAAAANNLANLLMQTNRLDDAEPLFRRALAILEKSHGPEHPAVATALRNLARLQRRADRVNDAEPLLRRALAIDEKSLGPGHPSVAIDLEDLAGLQLEAGRHAEAEPLYRRALAINENAHGPGHPSVAIELNYLAVLRAELGDWAEAAELHRRAVPIMTGARGQNGDRLAKTARATARAVYRADGDRTEVRAESFELAQWALQTAAANALGQMAVRFAKGNGTLAELVRQRQDLVAKREGEDKRMLAAVGKADTKTAAALRTSIAALDAELDAIDRRLDAEFPEYAGLANPKPLAIAAVQRLLKAEEALVMFLDVPRIGRLPGGTLAWAVTRTEARWIGVPLGTEALAERVARLRCGLDRDGNWTWDSQRRRWLARSERCRTLAPEGLADGAPLRFDVGIAHELYTALLAPFADLTSGKSLLVVPSGPLTSLPFHTLVMTPPSDGVRPSASGSDTPDAVSPKSAPAEATEHKEGRMVSDPPGLTRLGERGNVTWLGLAKPITVLPSVGSLEALRKLPPSAARQLYLAFGNPLLDGDRAPELAALARARQSCAPGTATVRRRVAAADTPVSDLTALYRRGIDLALLRNQAPLPETADEVCAVARSLGALDNETDTVWLGARATEANLKALSRSGALARTHVLHFATHGVLAGESEAILKARAEPALILTPPADGATPAELEEDDGLLTASEVAQLNLDADWVVLSACNTAASANGDAEALSGLARAFFYAKARALLVSHWAVDSEAAVALTTGAFAELGAHPGIGRAEALRRSMARLILEGRRYQAHPQYWAPFVLVGEGAT